MAITPTTYNLRVQRRADYPFEVQFKDGDGNPVNLTGWTVVAQCWDKCRTSKIGDFIVTVASAAEGKVTLKLPYTVTTNLPAEAYYDVMLINPSGLREYYLEGVVRASQGFSAPA